MAKISEESIERVAAASDIVEIIGSYFPLKRAGTSFRALCPFHREKSPSFHVNAVRQSFHCFGCGAGGGVFRFVMDYEHVDFPTAVRRLAQRSGIVLIEESNAEEESRRSERTRLLELHREVTDWFHHNLLRAPGAAHAREYLKKRGLHKEIAISWRLGYAPAGWEGLRQWADQHGYTRAELLSGGLLSSGDHGDGYDRFRDRLMFPIHNDYGDVIAFSGRMLGGESEGAKYLNSPETPIFSKSRVLFGMDKSKRPLIEAGEAIVLEGQIDLISAFEHGCTNVVAPQGTAFTSDQARLLRRFVERVVLCFDSDTAGQNAVERSLPALLANGFEIRVARLPIGEDPDSMIRKQGVEEFRKIVHHSSDFFDHAIDRALGDAGGKLAPRETASLAKRLAGHLSLLPDATLREITAAKVAARLGISTAALAQATPKKTAIPEEETRGEGGEIEIPLKISAGTELLCRIALISREARTWLRQQRSPSPRELDEELALLEKILSLSLEGSASEASLAIPLATLPLDLQSLISSWDLEKIAPNPLEAAQDAWIGLKTTHFKRLQAEATARLKMPGLDTMGIMAIQKEILDLKRRINELSEPARPASS